MLDPAGPTVDILRYLSGHEAVRPACVALFLAVVCLACALPLLALPKPTVRALHAFPRHRVTGIVLTAICVPWFALLLYYNIPFQNLQSRKTLLCLGALLLFFPIVHYMAGLLSVRALGALILLVGTPVMVGIRYVEEATGWPMWFTNTFMYFWVVIAMVWVLYPWKFRRWLRRFIEPDTPRVVLGVVFAVCALVFGYIGVRYF